MGRAVPPVPVRGNDGFPDPERPLVFDDSVPLDRVRSQGSAEEPAGVRADRAKRHALESMNHRPKRLTSVLIIAAVILLFGSLAYVGSRRSSSNHAHTASATASTASSASHRSSSSPVSDPSSGSGSGSGDKDKDKDKDKSTATTQPSRIVALTSTSTSATYPVGSTSYQVTVVATGSCWVAATSVSTGSTIWAGVLQAGAVQVIAATGTVTVQLGTPSAFLTLDKVPVILPRPAYSPFVATFRPTSATTPSVSTPATGSTTTTVNATTGAT
jgi:cytoskeletal protein RodZ